MKEIREIKSNIYKIAAVTDRGQRLNKLISPMYEEKANEMDELIGALKDFSFEISETLLSGEWELIFSNVELFRSSPFFLAIEKALNDEFKSNLFLNYINCKLDLLAYQLLGELLKRLILTKKNIYLLLTLQYLGSQQFLF